MNIKQLRESIARLLRESVCPGCGDKNAYIGGLNNVECPNASCKFFSEKQFAHRKIEVDASYAWECPKCAQKNILPYVHICPSCGHDPHDEENEGMRCARCGDMTVDGTCDCDDDEDEDEDEDDNNSVTLDRFEMYNRFPKALDEFEKWFTHVPRDGLFRYNQDDDTLWVKPGEMPGVDQIHNWDGFNGRWD